MKFTNHHPQTETIETESISDKEYKVTIFLKWDKYSDEIDGSVICNVKLDLAEDSDGSFYIHEVLVNKIQVFNHDDKKVINHEMTPKEVSDFLEDCETLKNYMNNELNKLSEEKDL